MKTNLRLQYYSSDYIMDFVARHPVDWCYDAPLIKQLNFTKVRDVTGRGGLADQCGRPPVPTMQVFFNAVTSLSRPITQEELWEWCKNAWGMQWLQSVPGQKVRRRPDGTLEQITLADLHEALRIKTYYNFYASAIDSLHVFALLVESGAAEWCVLDCAEDVLGGTDLSVGAGDLHCTIALRASTQWARDDAAHKQKNRGATTTQFVIEWPRSRLKGVGDKRWYTLDDLVPVLDALKHTTTQPNLFVESFDDCPF